MLQCFVFCIKRASPGIEPGPPAPKAGILPLNYKASIHIDNEEDTCYCQKGLCRESNPGLPYPKREFYHLTTKPIHIKENERVLIIQRFKKEKDK